MPRVPIVVVAGAAMIQVMEEEGRETMKEVALAEESIKRETKVREVEVVNQLMTRIAEIAVEAVVAEEVVETAIVVVVVEAKTRVMLRNH